MADGNIKYIKLAGGLGNLLFQYAFGMYLATRYGCGIRYFVGEDPVPGYEELRMLVPTLPIALQSQLREQRYAFRSNTHFRIIHKLLLLFPFLSSRKIVEVGSNYNPYIKADHELFDGYWQSYKYLEGIDVGASLTWPKQFEKEPILEELRKTNSVFVHIRRGDYLAFSDIFSSCREDYYQNAIAKMKEWLDNPVFYIFSDDINWVKENMKFTADVVYVSNRGEHAALQDLYCMQQCKHGIMANSTFSWWAAWLINNDSKHIVAPANWYVPKDMNDKTTNLIPPYWSRM